MQFFYQKNVLSFKIIFSDLFTCNEKNGTPAIDTARLAELA